MDIQEEIGLYKKYRDSKLNNFGLQLSDFKNLDEYLGCLTWLNAKSQAVPEQVLDSPACVGGGTFQTGVKWSTVISAAQRHYENDGHHEHPVVSVADQLRIASGHSVVMPREPIELMIRAACGSDDINEMALLEQQYKQMIEAAQEQKG